MSQIEECVHMSDREEFNRVVEFHGCYCLDIAVGYRVAKALLREMADEIQNMKEVFAQIGSSTCAVDAIQKITGCTLGKRNLIVSDLGKPVYILQNGRTKSAVRVYVHYWDNFDQSVLGVLKTQGKTDPEGKRRLNEYLDKQIQYILTTPEKDLFTWRRITLDAPVTGGKFEAIPCEKCGEYVNSHFIQSIDEHPLCKECAI